MKIDIQSHDFRLTESIREFIKKRIQLTLSSHFDQIKKITIRVSDINGHRNGIDKRCKVMISLPLLKEIVIDDVQDNLYRAIFLATERASRTVNRRLERLKTKKRKLYVPNNKSELVLNIQYGIRSGTDNLATY